MNRISSCISWALSIGFCVGIALPASASCPWEPENMNLDNEVDVMDVQCHLLTVLWALGDTQSVPAPACKQGPPAKGDMNCDLSWNVTDSMMVIRRALALNLATEIDTNQDNCVDTCLLNEDGDDLYDWEDTCPADPNDDEDNDGLCADADVCPIDPLKTTDVGICGCGIPDSNYATWYYDGDSDGYGDPNSTTGSCTKPNAYVDNKDDGCPNDKNKTSGGNCGCGSPESNYVTWYYDGDEDGYGDANNATTACYAVEDHVTNSGDGCPDDKNKTAGGTCGCGVPDTNYVTWYYDGDGDGYGDVNNTQDACSKPGGFVGNNDDACPDDGTKISGGYCGCGVSDSNYVLWYEDADNDGAGHPNVHKSACSQPNGYVGNKNDGCPSDGSKSSPGTCGCGVSDNNYVTWYYDGDGDGYGDPNSTTASCSKPGNYVSNKSDGCPSDKNKTSGGYCGCGLSDNNYVTWYLDQDGDDYGDPNNSVNSCYQVEDHVLNNDDGCPADDTKTSPGYCGCDVSESNYITWYYDGDGDNAGDPFTSTNACSQPANYVNNTIDGCPNDGTKTQEGNCGCGVPDSNYVTWYYDGDGDGYGWAPSTTSSCTQPSNYVSNANDQCPNDGNKSSSGTCGCGVSDENYIYWYSDDDGDGAGDPNTYTAACYQPQEHVSNNNDGCPDDPAKTSSGTCGCGVSDFNYIAWYPDTDGDGYGSPSSSITSCTKPSGYVSNNNDGCVDDYFKQSPGSCGCNSVEDDNDLDGSCDCLKGGSSCQGNCGQAGGFGEDNLEFFDDFGSECQCDFLCSSYGDCCDDFGFWCTPDGNTKPGMSCDACPNHAIKTSPGVCGCSVADLDSDGDGTMNCKDGCPYDALKTSPGNCGCGEPEGSCGCSGNQLVTVTFTSAGGGKITKTLQCNEGCFSYYDPYWGGYIDGFICNGEAQTCSGYYEECHSSCTYYPYCMDMWDDESEWL